MNEIETGVTGSLASRVRATFIAPGTLPALIRPLFPWLDVLLISTAIAIISVATVPDDYFVQSMAEPVSRRGEPVEVVSSPETVARWGRGMAMMATLATHPVVAVVLAGALLMVFTTFLRGPGTYREYLSLSSHALLIPAFGTVITIVLRLLTDATALSDLVGSGEPTSYPMALVLAIDPFVVWMLVALAIGIHRIGGRMSARRISLLLVGSYLVLVAFSTAILHRNLLA